MRKVHGITKYPFQSSNLNKITAQTIFGSTFQAYPQFVDSSIMQKFQEISDITDNFSTQLASFFDNLTTAVAHSA